MKQSKETMFLEDWAGKHASLFYGKILKLWLEVSTLSLWNVENSTDELVSHTQKWFLGYKQK